MRPLTIAIACLASLTAVFVGREAATGTDPIAVIAFRGTAVPAEASDRKAASAMFDSLITDELTRAGYRVIPPETTWAVRTHIVDSLGGLYNTTTGEIISAKRRAADIATLAALRATHRADVLLLAGVVIHNVPYDRDGKARWDGVTERVGVMEWSYAPVLSLVVFTTDTAGRSIHCGRGGIRALQSADFWSGKRRTIKTTDFFSVMNRNVAAVRRALASLTAHAPTCDSPSGG